MNIKHKKHSSTTPFLDKVRSHKKPYTTEVLGEEIIVYPGVMSPKYDEAPRFYIENMSDQKDKLFLEVGCGSGVISVFAGIQSAKKIVAIDINPDAVENTKANFKKHNFSNATTLESDLFEKIEEKFDSIIFNAPYHGDKPKDMLERGVSDENYETLTRFLKEARGYLTENGEVILGFSNTGDLNILNQLIIQNKYKITDFTEEEIDDWTAHLYVLQPITFSNQMQEFIYDDDYLWFNEYKDLIIKGKILKIGYGLGYASSFIKLYNKNIVNLDVEISPQALYPEDITLYEGTTFPFDGDSFDTVIANYTLHHTPDPLAILKEINRVSVKNIVVVEETHNNIFQKFSQVYVCWNSNKKANQSVNIHWGSYFSSEGLKKAFSKLSLKILKHKSFKRQNFLVEGFILEKSLKQSKKTERTKH